jgi:hypothetical protein
MRGALQQKFNPPPEWRLSETDMSEKLFGNPRNDVGGIPKTRYANAGTGITDFPKKSNPRDSEEIPFRSTNPTFEPPQLSRESFAIRPEI